MVSGLIQSLGVYSTPKPRAMSSPNHSVVSFPSGPSLKMGILNSGTVSDAAIKEYSVLLYSKSCLAVCLITQIDSAGRNSFRFRKTDNSREVCQTEKLLFSFVLRAVEK